MTREVLPSFVIVGPTKCATSWLYQCLYEHPEILMPETDNVHYFDMNYHKDTDWYKEYFSEYDGESIIGEETATYIRGEKIPSRILETLGEVKILICVRNPIQRAFSSWWHNYSHSEIAVSVEFEDTFDIYDTYQNWVEPGFYSQHISRFEEYFSSELIKLCFFDDLVEDDLTYIQNIFSFLDVDDSFVPPVAGEKVNQGRYRALHTGQLYNIITNLYKRLLPEIAVEAARPVNSLIEDLFTSKNKYEKGMGDEMREELEQIYIDDVRKLSERTDRNFDHWFKTVQV